MIQPIKDNLNFGRKSIIKTLFLEGQLPSVKVGIYGKELTPKNISLEHIQPRSLGGQSKLANYALADVFCNNTRSSEPLLKHTTVENIKAYLAQFEDVDLPKFNGKQYIENCMQTLKKLDIEV